MELGYRKEIHLMTKILGPKTMAGNLVGKMRIMIIGGGRGGIQPLHGSRGGTERAVGKRKIRSLRLIRWNQEARREGRAAGAGIRPFTADAVGLVCTGRAANE